MATQSEFWALFSRMQVCLTEFFQTYIKIEEGVDSKLSDEELLSRVIPTIGEATELTTAIESFSAFLQPSESPIKSKK